MPLLARWMAALYATKLSPAARDTLLAYATHLDRRGVIRVDLRVIQEWTGRSRATVARHIQEGIRYGLLVPVDRPNHGRPAAYRATIPMSHPE